MRHRRAKIVKNCPGYIRRRIRLSDRDARALLLLISEPPVVNDALRKAMERRIVFSD